MTKGTRKIGRTLSTIAESADKRAQERVAKVITPKAKKKKKKGNVKHTRASVQNESLGLDIGKSSLPFLIFENDHANPFCLSPGEIVVLGTQNPTVSVVESTPSRARRILLLI